MAELNYAGLVTAIVEQLRNDGTLNALDVGPVYVSPEPEPPTTDQCPAVIVLPRRVRRNPERIVANIFAGNPDKLEVNITLWCWAFSAQGSADAARQRDELVAAVVDAIRIERTIGGKVDWCDVSDIEFQWQPGNQSGSFFAVAAVTVIAHAYA